MSTTNDTAPTYYRLSTGGGMAPLAPHRDHFGRRTAEELRAWAREHNILPAMELAIEHGGGEGTRGTFDIGTAAGMPMLMWRIEPWQPSMDPYHRTRPAPAPVDDPQAAVGAVLTIPDMEDAYADLAALLAALAESPLLAGLGGHPGEKLREIASDVRGLASRRPSDDGESEEAIEPAPGWEDRAVNRARDAGLFNRVESAATEPTA